MDSENEDLKKIEEEFKTFEEYNNLYNDLKKEIEKEIKETQGDLEGIINQFIEEADEKNEEGLFLPFYTISVADAAGFDTVNLSLLLLNTKNAFDITAKIMKIMNPDENYSRYKNYKNEKEYKEAIRNALEGINNLYHKLKEKPLNLSEEDLSKLGELYEVTEGVIRFKLENQKIGQKVEELDKQAKDNINKKEEVKYKGRKVKELYEDVIKETKKYEDKKHLGAVSLWFVSSVIGQMGILKDTYLTWAEEYNKNRRE